MKSSFVFFSRITLAVVLFMPLLAAQARITETPVHSEVSKSGLTGTNSAVDTNSARMELEIPTATFDLTEKPTHDPFFPLSLRSPTPLATNSAPAFSAGDFTLKGLSGAVGNRLALINNRTLSAGESTVLNTPSGKIKINCLEVKESSVIIRIESQPTPVEIFLRKTAQ